MSIFSTVAFGDFDPVTGPPTIDGWTGNEDPGVVTDFAEAGYATGGRLTYGGGAAVPPVAFQCVHMTVAPASRAPRRPGRVPRVRLLLHVRLLVRRRRRRDDRADPGHDAGRAI